MPRIHLLPSGDLKISVIGAQVQENFVCRKKNIEAKSLNINYDKKENMLTYDVLRNKSYDAIAIF